MRGMKRLWLNIDGKLPAALKELERELGVEFRAGVVSGILADCQSNPVDAKQYCLYESATLSVTGEVDEYEPDDIRIQVQRNGIAEFIHRIRNLWTKRI
jgi:hypothetical protein